MRFHQTSKSITHAVIHSYTRLRVADKCSPLSRRIPVLFFTSDSFFDFFACFMSSIVAVVPNSANYDGLPHHYPLYQRTCLHRRFHFHSLSPSLTSIEIANSESKRICIPHPNTFLKDPGFHTYTQTKKNKHKLYELSYLYIHYSLCC